MGPEHCTHDSRNTILVLLPDPDGLLNCNLVKGVHGVLDVGVNALAIRGDADLDGVVDGPLDGDHDAEGRREGRRPEEGGECGAHDRSRCCVGWEDLVGGETPKGVKGRC